jgi:KUP system potassium uptake protein
VAAGMYTIMTTWKRGRTFLANILRRSSLPLDLFLRDVASRKPHRVPGTAVFMTSDPEGTPVVLLHHLKHNKVLHEQVMLMSITSQEVPEVPDEERVEVERLPEGFVRVIARYGFMEAPNVPEILEYCEESGLSHVKPHECSFFLGRERLIPVGRARMARWRKKLFGVMSRNAQGATEFFQIPPNRVVELGAQIEF